MEALQEHLIPIVVVLVLLALGGVMGFFLRGLLAGTRIRDAVAEAERIRREAEVSAKSSALQYVEEARREHETRVKQAEVEIRQFRQHVQTLEEKLERREESLEKRSEQLDARAERIEEREASTKSREGELSALMEKQKAELESVSGLSRDEARTILLDRLEGDLAGEFDQRIHRHEERIREEADSRAREILGMAIQRCGVEHVVESTVSVVELPNDDMKGRIIGREGRNIRAFETLTGIELIIDDTPEAVVLSGFDRLRRETAKLTLEALVEDGRIHPARIEEVYNKVTADLDKHLLELGRQAVLDVGIGSVEPEIMLTLGKLNYRTSYGQNVLTHSREVSILCGQIAAQLGTNVEVAKRAGLMHDLGKALSGEGEGPHAQLGADLARRHGESESVAQAIAGHHEEAEATTIEAVIVRVGDAISASRPGARRESLERYIKRLSKLEKIANSFEGVEKSFAIQAGREIRIMVQPDRVDDSHTSLMARQIAKKVEEELEYPGEVRVTVVREFRAVETAR
jgi:ribonuclease Y